MIIFKSWENQEILGDLMLQYDLTHNTKEITLIPFRVIEWGGCDANQELWNEENTEIEILMEGEIIFEGIRHCNFAEQDDGYINYPDIKNLGKLLIRLHELCLFYCSYYE